MTTQAWAIRSNPLFDRVIRPAFVRVRLAVRLAMFDRRYGVETESEVSLEELGTTDAYSNRYQALGLLRLRRIVPRREVSRDDVFLDVGSGKGRAVLQAALHYPFRAVWGIELSERLHRIAERNVERMRDRLPGTEILLVNASALDVQIPAEATVVLLNNPFRGEVFEKFIQLLMESADGNPRRVRVIYSCPTEADALLRTGRFRLVRVSRGWRPGREWSLSNTVQLYELLPCAQPGRRPSAP